MIKRGRERPRKKANSNVIKLDPFQLQFMIGIPYPASRYVQCLSS